MSQYKLCLHHELMLLILDDSKGKFTGGMYTLGLAGAALSELLLQGIIKVSDDDKKIVEVVASKEVNDPILDEIVQKIVESKKPQELKYWVSAVSSTKNLNHRVAQQLCDLEILRYDESIVLWFFTSKRYPEVDGSYEDAIRKRMASVMFKPEVKTDERTAVLICFAKASGVLDANFAKVELTQHKKNIDEICEGNQLAAGATTEALVAVQAAMTVAALAATIAATAAATAAT